METYRHTFGKILADARCTIAEALFTGKLLKIDGNQLIVPPLPDYPVYAFY